MKSVKGNREIEKFSHTEISGFVLIYQFVLSFVKTRDVLVCVAVKNSCKQLGSNKALTT